MNIRMILHVSDGDFLLFEGSPEDCPPVPRCGDEIVHQQYQVRLEGVTHRYLADELEISLLA